MCNHALRIMSKITNNTAYYEIMNDSVNLLGVLINFPGNSIK